MFLYHRTPGLPGQHPTVDEYRDDPSWDWDELIAATRDYGLWVSSSPVPALPFYGPSHEWVICLEPNEQLAALLEKGHYAWLIDARPQGIWYVPKTVLSAGVTSSYVDVDQW